ERGAGASKNAAHAARGDRARTAPADSAGLSERQYCAGRCATRGAGEPAIASRAPMDSAPVGLNKEAAVSTITYDEVNLMLQLYELRREAKLRQARSWYLDHFHLDSPDEMMEKYKAGSDEYNYIRMVLSYWEMVASIVNRGLINDELFFESNGEMWVVWDRI